jgi:PKD repeat protein
LSSAGSSDSDGSIASYSWDFGDGLASAAANPSHTYQNSGTFNVSLTVTDDDYANLSKPQMSEAKIWSTDGKNNMNYAIRKLNGSSWSQDYVETHATMKSVTVILADAVISVTQDSNIGGMRLSGNSLGNQIVTGIIYILKKEYVEGRVSSNLFPSRIALLDPCWSEGR